MSQYLPGKLSLRGRLWPTDVAILEGYRDQICLCLLNYGAVANAFLELSEADRQGFPPLTEMDGGD